MGEWRMFLGAHDRCSARRELWGVRDHELRFFGYVDEIDVYAMRKR